MRLEVVSKFKQVLKVGEVFQIEDTLTCNKGFYQVAEYTPDSIKFNSLSGALPKVIKPEDCNRYILKECEVSYKVKDETKVKAETKVSASDKAVEDDKIMKDLLEILYGGKF